MSKMTNCKACGKEIAKGAKICPNCGKDQRNFFMKHKILTGIIILIVLGGAGAAAGNNNNTGNNTNTATQGIQKDDSAGKMTKEKFDKIQNGMSYEEVTNIIGGPGEVLSESGNKGDELYTVMYKYDGVGDLGANSNLMFQGNKLQNKAQMGLK